MEGYISLHRKITENPMYFSETFTRCQAWIDLLLIANHKDTYFYIRGNKVNISRGMIGYSKDKLGKRWRWSRDKVNRFLNQLEIEQQVIQQKSKLTTLISIVNYDIYQLGNTTDNTTDKSSDNTTDKSSDNTTDKSSDNTTDKSSDNTTEKHQTIQQTDTDNNDKNDNKRDSSDLTPVKPPRTVTKYSEIIQLFNETFTGKLPRVEALTDKRKASINARITAHGRESIPEVFEKVLESQFLLGSNDRNWKADFDWIFKPENYIKILENNYKNYGKGNAGSTKEDRDKNFIAHIAEKAKMGN